MKKSVFGTKEWAAYSANVTVGCSHNCLYCYSRDAYRKYDKSGVAWEVERTDEAALNKKWNKKNGTIMFPTKHDITKYNLDDCIVLLKNILSAGNNVLIVSKPEAEVIDKLSDALIEFKDKILFRFTIGSKNDDILSFWEPGATTFEERKIALKIVFDKGFETSVSMEPLLDNDPVETVALVESLRPYVTNSIWIGKMNRADERLPFTNDFIESYLARQNDENIFAIYDIFKDDSLIKWKESFKKVVGIDVPEEAGLDI